MTLSEFRYIVAVAKELHFGRAAVRCFVSQPTLSVAIKKLEDELGVALFERRRHRVSVTSAGEAIIRQAEIILNETNNLKEIALRNRDAPLSEIKLGVIYTIGPYLLPRLIPLINREKSRLRLLIEEDFTEALSGKLKMGDIDVAILAKPFDETGIITETLYKENFMIALPANHPLTQKNKLKPDDLRNDTMLLLKAGNCFRDQVIELCPSCVHSVTSGNPLQKMLESSSIETICQMVATGAGITILPALSTESTDNNMKRLIEYRPFAKPAPYREVIIAYRKSWPEKRVIELLKRLVNNVRPNNQGTAASAIF